MNREPPHQLEKWRTNIAAAAASDNLRRGPNGVAAKVRRRRGESGANRLGLPPRIQRTGEPGKTIVQSADEVRVYRGPTLSGAWLDDLDLRGLDLTETTLSGVNLRKVGLGGAILTRTNWARVELSSCDLQRADLQDAAFEGARLQQCNLAQVQLVGARVRNAHFLDCMMPGLCMDGARWKDVVVEGADTPYLSAEKAVLLRCRFANQRLGGAPLMRARLGAAFLLECDLRFANLYAADLRGAVLIRCDLSDAHFDDADLTGTVLVDCKSERTDWANCRR